jgi:hypothetical protein
VAEVGVSSLDKLDKSLHLLVCFVSVVKIEQRFLAKNEQLLTTIIAI